MSVHHDEDAEIYLNGVLASRLLGFGPDYDDLPISEEASATLRPGKNLLAVHCHQIGGGEYIDVGIVQQASWPLRRGERSLDCVLPARVQKVIRALPGWSVGQRALRETLGAARGKRAAASGRSFVTVGNAELGYRGAVVWR